MVAYFVLDWKHVTVSSTRKSPLYGHRAAAFCCDLYCIAGGLWHRQPLRRPLTHDPLTSQV
jgi:hypothetical protein